jgi:predicted transcriptional regulator
LTEEAWEKLGVGRLESGLSSLELQRPSPARLTLRPKRSRLERYIDILRVVSEHGPLRRTHILYKANLSWSDLDDTLRRLEVAGTLHRLESGKRVYYEITDEGRRFLAMYARDRLTV